MADKRSIDRPFALMIAPGPFFVDRGFGVLVLEQARALARRGFRVEVVAYPAGRDLDDLTIHRTFPFPGYGETKTGPSLARLPLWVLLLIKTFLVARRTRPDVIHGHLHEGGLIALIVSRLTGIPWLFDFQGSLTLEMAEKGAIRERSYAFRFISFFEGLIDRRAPLILVKSQVMEDDLTSRFNVDPERIRRVMDGADPNLFSPRAPDPSLLKRFGLPSSQIILCYLGLLNEQQGTERMLAAMVQVVKERPDSHLLIIGYPTEGWVARARALGLDKNVTFVGRVDHHRVPDYLALADLALAPKVSDTEGNGKVYHYMSMELPTVAIDCVGNRELLGDDGYYVAGYGPDDFARGVLAAIAVREEWAKRGARLRQRVIDNLSWDAVAERIVDAYATVSPKMQSATQTSHV